MTHLVNGRAKHAQVYPPKLVAAILKGTRKELRKLGDLSPLDEAVAGPCPNGESNVPTEGLQPVGEKKYEKPSMIV